MFLMKISIGLCAPTNTVDCWVAQTPTLPPPTTSGPTTVPPTTPPPVTTPPPTGPPTLAPAFA